MNDRSGADAFGPRADEFFATRDAITQFLFLEDPPAPVDLAVVLGSPTVSSVVPAVELYLAGLAPRLLITGHGPADLPQPEWQLYRDYALAHGVPPSALLIEPNARNTLENFTLSAPVIAAELGWSNVRTISLSAKPFHMRRALMTARKHWPAHLHFVMRPSRAPDDAQAASWWRTEHGRYYVLLEMRAIGQYALEGHIGGY